MKVYRVTKRQTHIGFEITSTSKTPLYESNWTIRQILLPPNLINRPLPPRQPTDKDFQCREAAERYCSQKTREDLGQD
jgi:hypothetical protein